MHSLCSGPCLLRRNRNKRKMEFWTLSLHHFCLGSLRNAPSWSLVGEISIRSGADGRCQTSSCPDPGGTDITGAKPPISEMGKLRSGLQGWFGYEATLGLGLKNYRSGPGAMA